MSVGYHQFGLLFLTVIGTIGTCDSAAVGRGSETENGHEFYENNPFFNDSFPAEPHRHSHYTGDHHHHDHKFYHNHNEDNSHQFPESDHFLEDDGPTSESPKTTMRRDTADDESDYPYEEIRKFLKTNPLLKQYFAGIPNIGNRHGGTSDDHDDGESLCKTQTIRTYHPQKLKNINDVEKVIVNDHEEYVQAIEEKKCASNGGSCSISFDTFGYSSYCQQTFDIKRLMVFDSESKKAVFDEFRIPSCCVCKIKRNK